jgi:hypothetical protein
MSALASVGSGRDTASFLNEMARDVGKYINKNYGDFLDVYNTLRIDSIEEFIKWNE